MGAHGLQRSVLLSVCTLTSTTWSALFSASAMHYDTAFQRLHIAHETLQPPVSAKGVVTCTNLPVATCTFSQGVLLWYHYLGFYGSVHALQPGPRLLAAGAELKPLSAAASCRPPEGVKQRLPAT